MSRSTPNTGLTPAVLKWARESANMSVEDVARRMNKNTQIIEAWETGEAIPTYSQLEKLAYDLYKRPLALFFMPSPPEEAKVRAEFRSLPDSELNYLSRDTILLIRRARAFQAALIELYGDRNPIENLIWRLFKASPRKNIIDQAAQIRQALGVSVDDIRQLNDDDAALKIWRRAIERGGVHVFKDSFKQREFSGICLWNSEFPIILLNNSTTKTRQIFSLLHELAHALCDRSAISRFDDRGIDDLPLQDRRIERFCNALAAEILVPTKDFESEIAGFDPNSANDAEFSEIAARYHVSRSVILRRFVDRGSVSLESYLETDRRWAAQRREKEDNGGGNYYNTQGAYLSERFLREVISRYSRQLLTKAEASDLIGIKSRNFDQFEDLVLRGNAA